MTQNDQVSGRQAPQEQGPIIVLVQAQMGENIGAAARAMLNFGLTGLRLVAPRDGWPNARAGATAAGASTVLDNVRLFDTVEEAVADCRYVLATTARHRGLFLPVVTPEEAAPQLRQHAARGERTAVLFGGEKAGLETRDVAMANGILTIPVNPDFSSLNLAQAVLCIAYEWSRSGTASPLFQSNYEGDRADHAETEGAVGHLFETLEQAQYFYPEHKRPSMEHNLRTLMRNADLSPAELRLFRGVLRQMQWKIGQNEGAENDRLHLKGGATD